MSRRGDSGHMLALARICSEVSFKSLAYFLIGFGFSFGSGVESGMTALGVSKGDGLFEGLDIDGGVQQEMIRAHTKLARVAELVVQNLESRERRGSLALCSQAGGLGLIYS